MLCASLSLAACLTAVPTISAAQTAYPSRPITIIVPFSAGGGVDIVARQLAEKLRAYFKASIVVENRTGGSGMIGAVAVARAPKDGYTLLMASAGEIAVNPHIFKGKIQYALDTDIVPVSLVVKVPLVIAVNPALPIKSVDDLVGYARQHPGKLSYGTSGIGNPQHLAGELLQQVAGVKMTHVPYRGAANQLVDTAGGSIDLTFVSLAGARPFMKDGRVRAIAMTSPARTPLAPDLPAASEATGLSKYTLENWFGLFAPAGTPVPVLDQLNQAVAASLKDDDLAHKLKELGGDPTPMPGAQFRNFIRAESERFGKVVEEAKITVEN